MAEAVKKIREKAKVLDCFKPYESFSRVFIDAYVIVDETGKVVKTNQLFSQLCGEKSRQILKADSLDSLIRLSINSKDIPVAELLESPNPMRIDEVAGALPKGDELLNLILSVYPFFGDDETTPLGALILLRDVTAETNLQDKYKTSTIKSITDPLTGCFTRSYFEDYLNLQQRTYGGSEGLAGEVAIVMVDIDFFKRVNDDHGHQAGDYVLQTLSALMRREFRKTDVVCRYGGEEFLIILPNASLHNAALAANKLRGSVEAAVFEFNGKVIPVTISSGVALINFNSETYSDTIARADAALYHAKGSGRNMVCYHDGNDILQHRAANNR